MTAPPILPAPPAEYDAKYISDLLRVLNLHFRRSGTPDIVVSGQLMLTNLPTSATGLSVGMVWNDAGTLRIVI